MSANSGPPPVMMNNMTPLSVNLNDASGKVHSQNHLESSLNHLSPNTRKQLLNSLPAVRSNNLISPVTNPNAMTFENCGFDIDSTSLNLLQETDILKVFDESFNWEHCCAVTANVKYIYVLSCMYNNVAEAIFVITFYWKIYRVYYFEVSRCKKAFIVSFPFEEEEIILKNVSVQRQSCKIVNLRSRNSVLWKTEWKIVKCLY